MEQHILANRKHGNVDDQRRLALRIYDEAFMKCAVASAAVRPFVCYRCFSPLVSRGEHQATHTAFSTIRWNPSSIIHLDLSKQQLQVFHVGPLVSLQTLNVSHNFLTRITMGGLAACTSLTTLDVSKNLLADHANVKYLSLLPSLNVLKLAGNPLAEDKHVRSGLKLCCVCFS
jgi:Leucine rich repeat